MHRGLIRLIRLTRCASRDAFRSLRQCTRLKQYDFNVNHVVGAQKDERVKCMGRELREKQ